MNPIVFATRRQATTLMLVVSLIRGGLHLLTLTIHGATQLRGLLLARVHLSERDALPEEAVTITNLERIQATYDPR